MHSTLIKIFIALIFIVVLGFPSSSSNAYVLQGNHILYLAVKKIESSSNLSAVQTLTIYESDSNGANTEFEETVNYNFPKQFRSDLLTGQASKIHIFSKNEAITIFNNTISSNPESELDHYKDLLLFRNRSLLEERLALLGVDISISSLGRFQNRIFYIVGAKYPDETLPQVWIEKETFLPTRYLLVEKSKSTIDSIIEFRYLSWMKTEKTWYPMRIETYVDEKLVRTIDVKRIDTNPVFEKDLFDIAPLKTLYPSVTPDPSDPSDRKEVDDLEEVQQSIEDFKKRFE
jgi:outer membrane lipoprotein-sorting protein